MEVVGAVERKRGRGKRNAGERLKGREEGGGEGRGVKTVTVYPKPKYLRLPKKSVRNHKGFRPGRPNGGVRYAISPPRSCFAKINHNVQDKVLFCYPTFISPNIALKSSSTTLSSPPPSPPSSPLSPPPSPASHHTTLPGLSTHARYLRHRRTG